MLERIELLHGQCIHVGAQTQRPAIVAFAVYGSNHPCDAQAPVYGYAPRFQLPGNEVGSADLLIGEFRVGVNIASDL